MEGLNIQHPNQVRKKNKSPPPSPIPACPPRDTKDPSNELLIATFQRPMTSYKHFDTRICGIPLSSPSRRFLCFHQCMACALRPISQDVPHSRHPHQVKLSPQQRAAAARGWSMMRPSPKERTEAEGRQVGAGSQKTGFATSSFVVICHLWCGLASQPLPP